VSPSFVWLGVLLVLASYLVVSALLAASFALAGRRLERRAAAASSASRRAGLLYAACVVPTVGGLLAAIGFALPAWLIHEPLGTDEAAPRGLLVLGFAAAVLLARAWRRAFVEHRRTARAVAEWRRQARAAPLSGLAIPALRVEHGFPLAAVAGVVRPRLLLARQVVEALTPEELRAVATHEAGHVAAGDVLKRLVLRACPDPLPWRRDRARLERDWERAAEAAADEYAARHVSRIVLARALLKIAGLVKPGTRLTLEVPAFAAGAPVATRVMDLLADEEPPVREASRHAVRVLPLLVLATAAGAWLLALPFVLPGVHALLEAVVKGLI
jgi:Zn-dependent protease with chaperone function